MNMLSITIASAVLAAFVIGYQSWRIDTLKDDMRSSSIELRACGARLNNLIEDLESDNEIDTLPDDALGAVPDRWLRPETD